MIKLFRKIRYDLLVTNKTGKYVKYAIGEIILVVIGILIALQINNWNQERLQMQALNNIYTIIAEDLKNDISEINLILEGKKKVEPIFDKVLDGLMTKKEYDNCEQCVFLITGGPNLSIEKRGLNLLNDFKTTNESANVLTNKIVQFYKKRVTDLTVDDALRSNDILLNINDWKNNYNWYSDYITGRNNVGFIEYALNNQNYRNRVANYYLLNYTVYVPKLEVFNSEAETILEELEEYLSEE